MDAYVLIQVTPDLGAKLTQLGVLAGSPSAAIARLIEHWEQTNPTRAAAVAPSPAPTAGAIWVTQNGDVLPVGALLEGRYRSKVYRADVEPRGIRFAGTVHASPTAAARAVKLSVGVSGSAASTDGRDFWKLRDPSTGRLVAIKDLIPRAPIDTQRILETLRLKGQTAHRPTKQV